MADPIIDFPVTPYALTTYKIIYIARFWTKVDASGDCWEWQGALDGNGVYGIATVRMRTPGKSTSKGAHLFSWEILMGEIPTGLQLDHLCFNTPCVNPDHLEPVPPWLNIQRRRYNGRRVYCKRGHELTKDSVYYYPATGKRVCKACQLIRDTERALRKR